MLKLSIIKKNVSVVHNKRNLNIVLVTQFERYVFFNSSSLKIFFSS